MADSHGGESSSGGTPTIQNDHEPLSFLQPLGYSSSLCGYCSEVKGTRSRAKSSQSYGCWAHTLSAGTYKALLDRGWRRSGAYLYKPDMARTCCPQYTISLDPSAFKPSRSQRQVLQRFNAYMRTGEREAQLGWGRPPPPPQSSHSGATSVRTSLAGSTLPSEGRGDVDMQETSFKSPHAAKKLDDGKGKGKGKAAALHEASDWGEAVHAGEWVHSAPEKPFKHRFDCIVEPASFTDEKYALFRRYQMEVHGEPASRVSAKGFRRFLCDTPLDLEPTNSAAYHYGSHHALYRLDGQLIAFAVLDLLPRAVSSVYFVWNPDYAGMSLGKISALREAQLVREMEAAGAWEGAGGRYMMGYYIHTCPKMRYKADYQPSFLLDPDQNVYVPFSRCKAYLDTGARVTSFSGPLPPAASSTADSCAPAPMPVAPVATSHRPVSRTSSKSGSASGSSERDDTADPTDDDDDDDAEVTFPEPPPPGCLDPNKLPKDVLLSSLVLERRSLVPLLLSAAWHDRFAQQEVRELLAVTGQELAGRIAFFMGR